VTLIPGLAPGMRFTSFLDNEVTNLYPLEKRIVMNCFVTRHLPLSLWHLWHIWFLSPLLLLIINYEYPITQLPDH
jgi:hypothetical protein